MMETLSLPAHCHGATSQARTPSGLTFALQALLNRHETYINESQQEHERLTSYVAKLESDRTTLLSANEKIVEENRQLLTQLEVANTSLKDSDSHVKSLEALLRECEVEVRRLAGLSRRTEELELKILDLERERLVMSRQTDDAREESRSTIKRWRESEVKLRQLESEMERIEWDAKKDKERYEEIIARLERERALERELGGAEGRLKGAAALRGLNGSGKSTTAVSHFVRDILQDNANLQAGIAELRELLQTSNEEVQNLREQVLQHQPLDSGEGQTLSRSVSLSEQIEWSQPTSNVQQSVHVHHHYHAKLGKRDRTPTVRRPGRKRASVGLGILPSTPESSAPSTPIVAPHRYVSSPILPTSLHHPQPLRNRWSVQSTATASSMASSFPSSPRSYFEQTGSIFDRLEAGEESSRPTSPESSVIPASPLKLKRRSDFSPGPLDIDSSESVQVHVMVEDDDPAAEQKQQVGGSHAEQREGPPSQELTPKPSQMLLDETREELPIEPEPPDLTTKMESSREHKTPALPEIVVEESQSLQENMHESDAPEMETQYDLGSSAVVYEDADIEIRPSLRRRGSHDSLVSISGMDIHIAKRPTTSTSQSSLPRGNRAYFAGPPSAARRMPSSQALTAVTEYTALPSTRSFSSSTSNSTLAESSPPARSVSSSIAALHGIKGFSTSPHDEQSSPPGGFTRLVGGWVRGKWGVAPVKSTTDLRSSAASISTTSSGESRAQAPAPFMLGRSPGINQKGPIPGFRAPQRITSVQVSRIDEEGLKETLAG
jgi:hypothetical protein